MWKKQENIQRLLFQPVMKKGLSISFKKKTPQKNHHNLPWPEKIMAEEKGAKQVKNWMKDDLLFWLAKASFPRKGFALEIN